MAKRAPWWSPICESFGVHTKIPELISVCVMCVCLCVYVCVYDVCVCMWVCAYVRVYVYGSHFVLFCTMFWYIRLTRTHTHTWRTHTHDARTHDTHIHDNTHKQVSVSVAYSPSTYAAPLRVYAATHKPCTSWPNLIPVVLNLYLLV